MKLVIITRVSFVSLILIILCLFENAFALTPFVRQEHLDSTDDWYILEGSQRRVMPENLVGNITGSNLGNLESITYFSDGSTLNATFWLNSPINMNPPLNHRPVYAIYIDIDSNRETGHGGIDYTFSYGWNDTMKTWESEIFELSKYVKGRPIVNNNFLDVSVGKYYVSLSIDLQLINNPVQYLMTFVIADFLNPKDNQTRIIRVLDSSDTVSLPPPDFVLSTLPKTIEVRQGEEKNIELEVKPVVSNDRIEPKLDLNNYQSDNIVLSFTPNHTTIPALGFATSSLKVKASDNAIPRSYTLPISANISYPSEFFGNPSAIITEKSNFTAVVLPRLTAAEQLSIFVQDWFNPLTGIIATLLSIGSGFLGWLIGNKKK